MKNYIVYEEKYGKKMLENTTLEEVQKYIKDKQKELLDFNKKELAREEKDLEYFYEGQYDKMRILDRPYFLENGEWGLKALERETKHCIKYFKDKIKYYNNIKVFRIFEEL